MRPTPVLLLILLAACEYRPGGGADTTRAAGSVGDTAGADTAVAGSTTTPLPGDTVAAGVDSSALELHPEQPRRGGVLWARLRGTAGGQGAQCSWNGRPLRCYAEGNDVMAVVPLPADEPAGTFRLELAGGGRRIGRDVTVQEQDFGRELVFLDARTYALTQDAGAIARDGRAVRAVLAGESPERRWGTGRWQEPRGAKSAGYGVERFYYRATDSSRAITLGSDVRTSSSFGADTASAPRRSGSVPAWRHAGVDLPLARGTRIVSPAEGLVADVGSYQLTGRTLLIDHGQGVFSAFFHLDTITARRGDVVTAGQAVARVGSSGLSTGPHLHYGVYVHGKDVDPAAWKDMPSWFGRQVASDTSRARRTAR